MGIPYSGFMPGEYHPSQGTIGGSRGAKPPKRTVGPQRLWWERHNPFYGHVNTDWRPWGGTTTADEWRSWITGTAVDDQGNPMAYDEAFMTDVWNDATAMIANQMLGHGLLAGNWSRHWADLVGRETGQDFANAGYGDIPRGGDPLALQKEFMSSGYWQDVMNNLSSFYNDTGLTGTGEGRNQWSEARDWAWGLSRDLRDLLGEGFDLNNRYNVKEYNDLVNSYMTSANTLGIADPWKNLFQSMTQPRLATAPTMSWADTNAFMGQPRYGGTYYSPYNQRYL